MKNWLLLLIIVLLVIIPPVATFRLYLGTPPLALLLAMIPAALLGAVVVLLGRGAGASWRLLLAVFLWGALVAAFLAWTFNNLLLLWSVTWGEGELARRFTPIIAAPVVEELSKATVLALMLLLRRPWSVRTGMLCGALVGIGFAMTENTQYFLVAIVSGGLPGLGQAVYTRALLGGLNHAMFSAFTGAGIAWATREGASTAQRIGAAGAGLALAIGLHIVWNAVASNEIMQLLCNPESEGGVCRGTPSTFSLLVTAPLIELAFIAPGALLLRVLYRRDGGPYSGGTV